MVGKEKEMTVRVCHQFIRFFYLQHTKKAGGQRYDLSKLALLCLRHKRLKSLHKPDALLPNPYNSQVTLMNPTMFTA